MIDPSELNLSSLPWLPLEEKSAFPRKPAIYFAIDSQDNIQYIGRSVDPKSRWHRHHRYEQLETIGGIRIAYLFVELSTLLPEIEAALIEWFQPPLNVVGRSVLAALTVDDMGPINEEPRGDRLRDRLKFVEGDDYVVARCDGKSWIKAPREYWREKEGDFEGSSYSKVLQVARTEMSDRELLEAGLHPSDIVDKAFSDPERINAIASYLGLIPNGYVEYLYRLRRDRRKKPGQMAKDFEFIEWLRERQAAQN